MLVITYNTTQRHNPEDHNQHLHHCGNLIYQIVVSNFWYQKVCQNRLATNNVSISSEKDYIHTT
jgi:hypothetical protein